jgi:hypothetical protein
MGYLICDKCKNYYELQPGESPEDFVSECECGGTLRYAKSLNGIKEDFAASEATITCPNCGTENPEDAKSCRSCKRFLTPIKTPPKTGKTPKKDGKGILAWWNLQSTPIKVGSIIGVCLIALILIFGIGGMISTPNTTTINPNTTTSTPTITDPTTTTNPDNNTNLNTTNNTTPNTPSSTPNSPSSNPNTIYSTPTQSSTPTSSSGHSNV